MMKLSVVLLALLISEPANAELRRFALVVGSNATLNANLAPLRFADDDASRLSEFLSEVGVDVALVTTFDQQSQQMFWRLVDHASPATPQGLDSAYEALLTRMQAAKESGNTVDLLVYYSGHGDVGPDGNGYLTLDGGKLTRHDLFEGLLGRSPAHHNHLVIDACRSEELVLSRGGAWKPDRANVDYARAVRRYLDEHSMDHFTNTGVILATSSDQQTHEWERYRGGVFTHQLLSGLRGAADVNGDGAIEYSEIGAFVAAANSGVTVPRARLRVVVLPPKNDERHAVVQHDNVATQRVLLFPGSAKGRFALEDARGVRLADLHRAGGSPNYVRLPAGQVFVYRDLHPGLQQEATIAKEDQGPILLASLDFAVSARQARGAMQEAFRGGLFKVAYGPGYYAGYTDHSHLLAVRETDWKIQVWQRVDGDLVEVARVTESGAETVSEHDRQTELDEACHELVEELAELEEDDWDEQDWGSLSLGLEIAALGSNPNVEGARLTRVAKGGVPPAIGGFDLRWHSFDIGSDEIFPGSEFFFRTGYSQGGMDIKASSGSGYAVGEATKFSYQAVPIFFGTNAFFFDEFFLRPFVGFGVGLDVLLLDYARHHRENRNTVDTLFGFEVHAGIDVRVSNYVVLQAEARRLWSRTRKFKVLPNFSRDGTSLTFGVGVALPFNERGSRVRRHLHRHARRRDRPPEPSWQSSPDPAPDKSNAGPAEPVAPKDPPEQEPKESPDPEQETLQEQDNPQEVEPLGSPRSGKTMQERKEALEQALEREEEKRQAE